MDGLIRYQGYAATDTQGMLIRYQGYAATGYRTDGIAVDNATHRWQEAWLSEDDNLLRL